MTTYFTYVFRGILALLTLSALTAYGPARASDLAPEVGLKAVELAERIDRDNLITDGQWAKKALQSPDISNAERLRVARKIFVSSLWTSKPKDLKVLAEAYAEQARASGNFQDQNIGTVQSVFSDTFDGSFSEENYANIKSAMEPFMAVDDWFTQHRALYLVSQFETNSKTAHLALQSVQQALDLVPDDGSAYALEARILSTENIAQLHNLLRNPELAVLASVDQIALQIQAGEPVDGVSLINNLIFSFSIWRDHQTTMALVNILLRIEDRINTGVPGLTHMRAARIHNELSEYEDALTYSEEAIKRSQIASIQESAKLSRIVALAGLKRVQEAETALSMFLTNIPEEDQASIIAPQKILHARALIAMAKGDNLTSQRLMNQRLDANVQYILNANNGQTANMLAALQNTKERQDERESALLREAALKEVSLQRQKRVIILLFVSAAFLGVMAIGAAFFARYRSVAARDMARAAKKAQAGEKAKSEFLAVMSHELRTPLNGIMGMADHLSRAAPTDDLREKNAIILKSGHALLGLVENILDMTLIEGEDITLYPVDTDIAALIEKQINHWRSDIEAKNIIFTAHIDKSIPNKLNIDPKRLSQCVSNLLSNAAKFTMAGRVHLHVTGRHNGPGSICELSIIVADTGVGISSDAQVRLFKPFVQADSSTTRHYDGAGLGLAITRSLAQMMGGDVIANSRQGRGSEFSLIVRAAVSSENMIQSPQTANQVPNKTLKNTADWAMQDAKDDDQLTPAAAQRVLVVDDDVSCQAVARSLLEPKGFRLAFAHCGQEALQALSLSTFDIVIMDVRMPGMDGVTTIRRIREGISAHSHIPIIALTADTAKETNAKCLAAGVNVFLTKPIRGDDLYDAIAFACRQESARPSRPYRQSA